MARWTTCCCIAAALPLLFLPDAPQDAPTHVHRLAARAQGNNGTDLALTPDRVAAPSFVRIVIEPEGSSRFEGRGTPGSSVTLDADGRVLGTATVETSGKWQFRSDAPLHAGDHHISALGISADQSRRSFGEDVRVSIPADFKGSAIVAYENGGDRRTASRGEGVDPAAARRAAEELARAASDKFNEIVPQPDQPVRPRIAQTPPATPPPAAKEPPAAKQEAPPAAKQTQPGLSLDGVVGTVRDWLDKSNDEYQKRVIRELSQPMGEDTAKQPRKPAETAKTPTKDEARPASKETAAPAEPAPAAPETRPQSDPKVVPPPKVVEPVLPPNAEARRQAEAKQKADDDARKQADARRKADEDAKRQAEAKQKADAEAKRTADAKTKADADAKRKAEEDAKRQAEAKQKADAEAKRTADAKAKADADAKFKADDEAKRQAEAKQKADADARRLAEAKAKADADAKRIADTKAKADADAKQKAEAEAKRRADDEARKIAELAKQKAEAEAKRKAEDDARRADSRKTLSPVPPLPGRSDQRIAEGSAERGPVDGIAARGGRAPTADRPKRCRAAGRRISPPGTYVVARGDSLWKISRRHYAKGRRYNRIVRANAARIDDPDLIFPCQRLYLP